MIVDLMRMLVKLGVKPITMIVIYQGRNNGVRLLLAYLYDTPKGRIINKTIYFSLDDLVVIAKDNAPVLLRELITSCLLPIYDYMLGSAGALFDVRIEFEMLDDLGSTYRITIIGSNNVSNYKDLEISIDELMIKFVAKYGHYDVRRISNIVVKCRSIYE